MFLFFVVDVLYIYALVKCIIHVFFPFHLETRGPFHKAGLVKTLSFLSQSRSTQRLGLDSEVVEPAL